MLSAIPFIISMGLMILLLLKSKKNEDYVIEANELDKNQYTFKDAMSLGFYVADKMDIEKLKEKNKSLFDKMIAMYGLEAEVNFRRHIANKVVLGLIATNAVNFIVLANGELNIAFLLAGPIFGIVVYYLADTMQDEQFRKRSNQIKYDFPEFLTQLVLLINAGLTFERAWKKILDDSDDTTSPLIYELKKTYKDMKSNIPRTKCLNDLARRCKVQEVNKFSSIVIQNINKGSGDMVHMLTELSNECWIERKNIAKQKGEEASSKLLFPMMLILITVFVIVLVPAMMQMLAF